MRVFFSFYNIIMSVGRIRYNVPALAAGGDLEPQNCRAKQMQFRKKKLQPK
jgi:hypothetical protein